MSPSPRNQPGVDLNGRWIDNGRDIIITQTGDKVTANYVKEYECDPRDRTPVQKTKLDFEGTLRGNQLEGKTNTCKYGNQDPAKNGLVQEPIKLTLNANGKTLEGEWFRSSAGTWQPITITRKCPQGMDAQLKAAKSQGPQQLLSLCQSFLNQGVPQDCLHPYGALADCFGPGAHYLTSQQATGPGVVGFPFVLLNLTVSGSTAPPNVPVLTEVPRGPILLIKETCDTALCLLRDAEQFMRNSAVLHNRLRDQRMVIECLEELSRDQGW